MLRALSCSGLMAWLLLILAPLLVPPDQIVRLTPQVSEESSWSPDGRRLVFDSNRAGKTTSLFVMDADGGNVAQLTRGPGSDETPAWSPDGKRFAYVSDRSGHAEIWLVDADGKNPRQLTRHGGEAIHPHWSPDGRRVIYCAGREKPEQYEIFVADAASGAITQLTRAGGTLRIPPSTAGRAGRRTAAASCSAPTGPGSSASGS